MLSIANSSCPQWICTKLNYTTCATLHGYQIYANSNNCPTDFFCKISDFKTWSLTQPTSSTNSFPCTRQNYNGIDYNTLIKESNYFCGFRDSNQALLHGSHPKICYSEQDCLTVGGWTTECICGFDGNSYCSPDIGSNAFDEYWAQCNSQEGSTQDPKLSPVQKAYWDYYFNYYVQIISAPSCLKTLLWEFEILSDLAKYTQYSLSPILFYKSVMIVYIILI
jgi:hypothetical protein